MSPLSVTVSFSLIVGVTETFCSFGATLLTRTVALTLSDKGALVSGPRVDMTGVPDADAGGTPFMQIAYDAAMEAFESIPRARRRDPDAVAEALRRAVRSAVGTAWRKKPICHVHVLTI